MWGCEDTRISKIYRPPPSIKAEDEKTWNMCSTSNRCEAYFDKFYAVISAKGFWNTEILVVEHREQYWLWKKEEILSKYEDYKILAVRIMRTDFDETLHGFVWKMHQQMRIKIGNICSSWDSHFTAGKLPSPYASNNNYDNTC